MKKSKKRKITLFLVLMLSTLLFSGCNKFNFGNKDNNNNTNDNNTSKNKGQVSDSSAVLTVGDIKVSLDEAMVYADLFRNEYESMYGSSIWELDFGDYTFEDMAKESIIDQITKIKISIIKAGELGITLTDDELAEVEAEALSYYEEIVEQGIEGNITKELLQDMNMDNYLVDKVYEYVTKDVNTDISDDEARQITVQHLLIMTCEEDENEEIIPLSKEEQELALKKAEELLKKAKKADNFETFARENTEDETGVVEITFGKGEMDKDFEEVAFALKTGEISRIVKSDLGYHIIYCVNDFDEDATAEAKEELIIDKQDEAFLEIYELWSLDYPVNVNEKLWETVKFISEGGSGDNDIEWEIEEE